MSIAKALCPLAKPVVVRRMQKRNSGNTAPKFRFNISFALIKIIYAFIIRIAYSKF